MPASTAGARPTGLPRDVAAGLFLIALAGIGFFGTAGLTVSEGAGIGPGLMPRGVAVLMAGMGVLITALGLFGTPARLEGFSLRGPIFVLGAVALFAASIRTLGLAFAGPIAVIIAAMADRDSRPVEIVVYALIMTGLCLALFKFALRLPIPLAPMLLGY